MTNSTRHKGIILAGGSGTRLVVKVDSTDDRGDPVLTQYVTIFIRGMSDGESGGPDKPEHDFPEDARGRPATTFTIHVDDDQTFRYREASGDEMPIHPVGDHRRRQQRSGLDPVGDHLEVHRPQRGEQMPVGWMIDRQGRPLHPESSHSKARGSTTSPAV